jgi:flagellar hook-associated protein 3 FlgL
MANTSVAGRPMFGGITAGAKAYDTTTGAYVGQAGPGTEMLRRVSSTDSVRVDISGPEAFEGAGTDLFALVERITTNLTTDPAALEQDLADLDVVMNTMKSAVADVGARSARIDREAEITMGQSIALEEGLSQVEDIDLPNMMMRLKMQQTGYEAALSATAKSISPTLMDYLR